MTALYAWTTHDELTFIARLGTHSVHGAESDHRTWVERYAKTLPLRKDWTGLDQKAIRAAVKKALV